MNKSQLRKKILKIRKNNFNKNLKINTNNFISFLKTNTNSINNLGGYYPSNYEIDDLEILDFLPLSNVDYSGGIITTDWYNEGTASDESIKITVRFLTNEVRADGQLLVCEPATEVPMAQRYFLF